MKKMYLLIAFLFVAFTSSAISQNLFYADETFDQAKTTAEETLSNPELIYCMAMDMTDAEGIPIPVEFDWTTGKASMWIYYFVDANDNTQSSGIVAMNVPIIGFQVMSMDVTEWISELLEYSSMEQPLQKSDLNSQAMASVFTSDSEFAAELEIYQDNANLFVSLFHNASFPGLDAGKTYWGVLFDPDLSDKACAMEINTQDVECTTITSVEDNDVTASGLKLAANPVDDVLECQLPAGEEFTLTVFDVLGNVVKSNNHVANIAEVNVSDLEVGAYFIQISNGNNIQSQKFIKR